ncbi:glycoside hydrolase family 35 protein [Apiospora hydei]|uniref:Glycoside hydrolase family 35 protein n=1 Tax=Apiospora hydei TaxID=1337664 RepID=A0ABR1XDW1_9PEZI
MTSYFNPRRIVAASAILGAISQDIFSHAATTTTSTTGTASVTLAAPSSSSSIEAPYLEAEFIFPRNETYKESAVFPVTFAFRGLDAVRKIGRFTIQWSIMPYTNGVTPGGHLTRPRLLRRHPGGRRRLDRRRQHQRHGLATKRGPPGLRGALHDGLGPRLPDLRNSDDGPCERSYFIDRRIMFTIHSNFQIRMGRGAGYGDEVGIDAVVPADECPVFSTAVEFWPNATVPECPAFMEEWRTGRQGDPCGVRVDQDVASSIQSRASSMATASWLATQPPPTTTSTSSNFVALPTAPAGSAFVAVFLITYLTFGL